MSFVVGLDIGSRSLTGAVMAGSPAKFRLVDFFVEQIPVLGNEPPPVPGAEYVPPLSLGEVIQKIIDDKGLKTADFVVAVESKDCVLRQFQVPFTRDEQIRKVITFTAEEYFPAFSMDEVVLEYLKVGESNGKSQLIVAALRNQVIESRLQLLKTAGIDPVALDLDCAALFNAFALSPLHDPKRPTLLVDMGGTSTKIVLVEGGQIRKIRSFRTAAALVSADRLLAQPVGVGAGSAASGGASQESSDRSRKSIEARFQEIEGVLSRLEHMGGDEAGGEAPIAILSDDDFARVWEEAKGQMLSEAEATAPPPPPPSAARMLADRLSALSSAGEAQAEAATDPQEFLRRVVAEIQRTFAGTRTAIELVCVTGGLSNGEETTRFLSEELGVETVHIDFGDRLPMDVEVARRPEIQRHGAVAIGLALKEFGRDLAGLDFRKGRFRYEHRFSRLRVPLLLLSVMAFLFFLQTAFWAYREHQKETLVAATLDGQSLACFKAFFERDPVAGLTPLEDAKKQKKAWEGKGAGDVGKFVDAVECIRNVGEVLKKTGLRFKVSSSKFEFGVKAKMSAAAKKQSLQGIESQIDLVSEDSSAHLKIEEKFNRDAVSRFFTAKTSSQPTKDGFKVTVRLEFKEAALKTLE